MQVFAQGKWMNFEFCRGGGEGVYIRTRLNKRRPQGEKVAILPSKKKYTTEQTTTARLESRHFTKQKKLVPKVGLEPTATIAFNLFTTNSKDN